MLLKLLKHNQAALRAEGLEEEEVQQPEAVVGELRV
jgi:hypothetical protein